MNAISRVAPLCSNSEHPHYWVRVPCGEMHCEWCGAVEGEREAKIDSLLRMFPDHLFGLGPIYPESRRTWKGLK